MPDSSNFLAFWIVAWCAVVAAPRDFLRGSLACGIACAALSAIKPHGLVVTGAAMAAIGVAGLVRRETPARIATALTGLVAAFMLARYAIAFAATGSLAFSWFGTFYSRRTGQRVELYLFDGILGPVFWFCLAGHLLLLAVVFLPTAILGLRPGLEPRSDLPPGSMSRARHFHPALVWGCFLGYEGSRPAGRALTTPVS